MKRTSTSVSLHDATSLVCYTDGLIEASHDSAEGEARLRAAIEASTNLHVANPASYLLREVVEPPAPDDIAIFTVTFENGDE